MYLFEGSNFFIDAVDVNEIISSLNKDNLIEKICQWIDEKYYVTLILAECEIEGTALYKKSVYPHQQFIFGYDLNTKTFKITNFNDKNTYSIIDVSFDNIKKSFFSQNKVEAIKIYNSWGKGLQAKHPIILYKFREWDDRTYSLDSSLIKDKINDYLNSRDSSLFDKLHRIRTQEFEESKWGIKIYNNLDLYLKSQKYNQIDYIAFHCLWEHKKIMSKRLKYLENLEFLNPELKYSIKYQEEIERKAYLIRYYILKYNISNKKSCITKALILLSNIKKAEYGILSDICELL